MASRGYLDSSRMQARPLLLPFEFNEEEEREISEAIAREEELMRIEEENKSGLNLGNYELGSNVSRIYIPTDPIKHHPYVSNLLPSINDTPDDKIIKQVLDVMFSQVCRWDKQYGWSKMHLKKARQKNDTEKIHIRKMRLNQREMLLNEHIERLKKEINKRRTKMENEAEQQCGLLTPWRKSKTRPQRSSKQAKSNSEMKDVKKEVINPADITLGGDTFDYSKKIEQLKRSAPNESILKNKTEQPMESNSIASGVTRRRRTSNSKSEEDDEDAETGRSSKQRRLSEPRLVKKEEMEEIAPENVEEANEEEEEEEEVEEDEKEQQFTAGIDRNMLHCICRTYYDEKKFYVMCDMCNGWFHGECVELTEKRAMKMDGWTCQQCLEEQNRVKTSPQLYCLCQKPYDDTKFYVGCDSCQGWYHPECVKITRKDAEEAEEYICPLCKAVEDDEQQKGYESSSSEASNASRASSSVMLNRADYPHIMQLLELLLEHRMSSPFRRPVNTTEFPDYLQVIKNPMDLSTISKKVESIEYMFFKDFVADVNLMFENAKKYNPKDHAIFKCAETIQEAFEEKLIEVRDAIRKNHCQRKRVDSYGNNTLDGSLDIDTDQLINIDPNSFHLYDF